MRGGIPQWLLRHRVSSHREMLEKLEEPVILSAYPSILELETTAAYREAVFAGRA